MYMPGICACAYLTSVNQALGVKILGFDTAKGIQGKILAFVYVAYMQHGTS